MNSTLVIQPITRIFCDFDGTITRKDSGDEFFKTFSNFEPNHTDLMNGKITVKEYYERVCKDIRIPDEDTLDKFCSECEIDAYFTEFISFVHERHWHMHIVSDGFDVYIDRILKQIHADQVPKDRNVLKHVKEYDIWEPQFPMADERCTCFCASCKRNIVLGNSHPDDMIIYIGDGMSDSCPVHHADMIFAKGSLSAYCNQHSIVHHHWNTFFDIMRILKKRNPTMRDIARKERKKAYMAE